MPRPANPNKPPRKPREAKSANPSALLKQVTDSLTSAAGSLLALDSLEDASVAIIQLRGISKQAKEMQSLAEFIRARFESEADLRRQLEAANKPPSKAKPPAIAAE